MLRKFIFAAVMGFWVTNASAAETVQDWIKKMSDSSHKGNYQGTFVFWRDQKMEAMRVLHGSRDGRIWVSLESLNGEPRRLIHENGEVTSIFPDKHLVSINEMTSNLPFHPDLPDNLEQLTAHYQLDMLGHDRVANRDTQIISVRPKDGYRYGFKYWLDAQTGMMLRCDVVNEKQQVLEQTMFTDFEYLTQPPAEAFSPVKFPQDFQLVKQSEAQKFKAGDSWYASKLPEGFKMTKNILKPVHKQKSSVQQIIFSDGLATVSVFIDSNVSEMHRLDGYTSMGSVNAFGLMLDDHQITAIGEVPLDTVRLIARSIRHKK